VNSNSSHVKFKQMQYDELGTLKTNFEKSIYLVLFMFRYQLLGQRFNTHTVESVEPSNMIAYILDNTIHC
jgi:hypothetical protein